MSWQRMLQLKEALERAGWEISGESEKEGIFFVANDEIVWRLSSRWVDAETQLRFVLFGDLGRRTENLNDISHVLEEGNKVKLHFSKIKSEEWKTDLRASGVISESGFC